MTEVTMQLALFQGLVAPGSMQQNADSLGYAEEFMIACRSRVVDQPVQSDAPALTTACQREREKAFVLQTERVKI